MHVWRRRSNNTVLLLLILCARCCGLDLKRQSNDTTTNSNDTSPASTTCGFVGNNDIYGIGIRIGYYTQALSVWFANYFVLSEAKVLRSVNLLFLVAILVGLFWVSLQPGQTHAIEAFILLNLLSSTWVVGLIDQGAFSKKYWRFSPMRFVISDVTYMLCLGYNLWFWWYGIDLMTRTPCGTYIFICAKVDLYGWFRSVCKALVVPLAVFDIFAMLTRSIDFVRYFRPEAHKNPEFFRLLRELLAVQEDHQKAEDSGLKTLTSATPALPFMGSDSRRSIGTAMNGGSSVRSKLSINAVIDCEKDLDTLEAATQIPLPPSPLNASRGSAKNGSWRAHLTISPRMAYPFETDLPSLEALMDAEHYLQSILNVNVMDHGLWTCTIPIPGKPLDIILWSWHSPQTLYKRWKSLCRHRPFRLDILMPICLHLKSLERFTLYSYPLMLEEAMKSPLHQRISRPALETMLALHTAQLPKRRPFWRNIPRAAVALLMCIGFILSIELAIHWNDISGVGVVGVVGQLIPAILGVGGLVRVLWVWLTRGDVGVEEEEGVGKEVRECAEVYERLRREIDGEGAGRLRVHNWV